jgi:hypothetical protein
MTTVASTTANTGPLGKRRGTAFVILIGIVTIGIYWIYWAYKSHDEIKQHSGQGVGGVLGLVIYVLIGAVTAFLLPSEIGKMYAQDGQTPPVNGWTGLWMVPGAILVIPAFVWIVKVQGAMNRYWEAKGVT